MSQDDIPTPKQTGSWAISIGRAQALITRLERAYGEFYRFDSAHLDRRSADRCVRMVKELRDLVERFEQWPNNRPLADIERPRLLPRLDALTEETDEICLVLGRSY